MESEKIEGDETQEGKGTRKEHNKRSPSSRGGAMYVLSLARSRFPWLTELTNRPYRADDFLLPALSPHCVARTTLG